MYGTLFRFMKRLSGLYIVFANQKYSKVGKFQVNFLNVDELCASKSQTTFLRGENNHSWSQFFAWWIFMFEPKPLFPNVFCIALGLKLCSEKRSASTRKHKYEGWCTLFKEGTEYFGNWENSIKARLSQWCSLFSRQMSKSYKANNTLCPIRLEFAWCTHSPTKVWNLPMIMVRWFIVLKWHFEVLSTLKNKSYQPKWH